MFCLNIWSVGLFLLKIPGWDDFLKLYDDPMVKKSAFERGSLSGFVKADQFLHQTSINAPLMNKPAHLSHELIMVSEGKHKIQILLSDEVCM